MTKSITIPLELLFLNGTLTLDPTWTKPCNFLGIVYVNVLKFDMGNATSANMINFWRAYLFKVGVLK